MYIHIVCLTLQKQRDVLQLGNVVLGVATVLLQEGDDMVELFACVSREQILQTRVDSLPSLGLLLRVFHFWNRLATENKKGQYCGRSGIKRDPYCL